MTPEQLQKMQQLEQQLAQVAAERDALQAEVDGLKGRFLDHSETDSYLRMVKYAAHVKDLYRFEKEQKEKIQAERDALQKRVDCAIAQLSLKYNERLFSEHYILGLKTEDIKRAIEILTGEGENGA